MKSKSCGRPSTHTHIRSEATSNMFKSCYFFIIKDSHNKLKDKHQQEIALFSPKCIILQEHWSTHGQIAKYKYSVTH